MSGVLIVGAGLGALRTAESLRGSGYTGRITVVGDEDHLPYNRPPLSKEALAGGIDVHALEFRRRPSTDDVEWLLGSAAESADLDGRTVTLDEGRVLEFDALVAATGIRSRRPPIPGPHQGRFALRTAFDALQLREQLRPGANVVILGAGFIGCEVAATARGLGCNVHVVAMDEQPMLRPLGAELGAAMRRRHEAQGVVFHLGQSIQSFTGDDRVIGAVLGDGTEIPADVVVEAVGSVANTEWLEGTGLDLSDGLLVDSGMQVVGTPVPMAAVGDLARHPNALFGGVPRRIEHWNMPTETGRRAGETLAARMAGSDAAPAPFAAMPSFWTDQYHHKLQSFGMPGLATRIEVVDGDVDDACIVEYHDDSGLVGVVGVDRTSEIARYRKLLLERP